MKLTVVFLVLSMVVLMAEPGECIFGLIFRGAAHIGRMIHGFIQRRRGRHGFDEKLDKRSIDYNPGRPGYD